MKSPAIMLIAGEASGDTLAESSPLFTALPAGCKK